jgi:hypothetical protein
VCVLCTMCTNEGRRVRLVVSACPPACLNFRTDGRILMKFGMDILPLGASPNSCFSISYQHDERSDVWGGSDTSATHYRVLELCLVTNLWKISTFSYSLAPACSLYLAFDLIAITSEPLSETREILYGDRSYTCLQILY